MGRFLLVAAVVALGLSPLQAEDAAGPAASPVAFPVRIEEPTLNGGHNIKSGEPFYEVTLRSVKAVRIAEPYTFTFHPRPPDLRNLNGKDPAITLPAGTILVMALANDGAMFCTAGSEGEDGSMSFYDIGYCARDTNNDGVFDQELVIEQNPWRTRIAYEIYGTHEAVWRAAKLAYQSVEDVPPVRIQFYFLFTKSGGLFSFGSKPRAYYSDLMRWPVSLIVAPVRESRISNTADFNIGAFRSTDFERKYSLLVSDNPGRETEIVMPPFGFKLKLNPDNTLDAEVKSGIAPGLALLAVAGRNWTVNDYRYQGTIMRLRPVSAQ